MIRLKIPASLPAAEKEKLAAYQLLINKELNKEIYNIYFKTLELLNTQVCFALAAGEKE